MPISKTYNLDWMKAGSTMPERIDLALVDCPYGIGEDGSTNKSRSCLGLSKDYKGYSGNDEEAPPKEVFDRIFKISKNQIIWGANHFIERINRDSSCWIVWDKQNGKNDFADCELAWTSFTSAVRKFDFRWQGMIQGNMKNKESRIHPNQKPVALYRWLLSTYAKQGDVIADFYLGSGSSRIAAWDLGLDFIGYEIDSYYFEAQEKRFADHIAQPRLFEPVVRVEQTKLF